MVRDGYVALLAEGVDRNCFREATKTCADHVALLAEGVDRNHRSGAYHLIVEGRPPRGGRG